MERDRRAAASRIVEIPAQRRFFAQRRAGDERIVVRDGSLRHRGQPCRVLEIADAEDLLEEPEIRDDERRRLPMVDRVEGELGCDRESEAADRDRSQRSAPRAARPLPQPEKRQSEPPRHDQKQVRRAHHQREPGGHAAAEHCPERKTGPPLHDPERGGEHEQCQRGAFGQAFGRVDQHVAVHEQPAEGDPGDAHAGGRQRSAEQEDRRDVGRELEREQQYGERGPCRRGRAQHQAREPRIAVGAHRRALDLRPHAARSHLAGHVEVLRCVPRRRVPDLVREKPESHGYGDCKARPLAPGEGLVPRTTHQIFGSVTPCCPWYLPPRSLYDVSQTSSDSKKITCATPSLA